MSKKLTFSKNKLMNDVLFEVMKREPGDPLYKDKIPNIYELQSDRQIVYFDIKGNPRATFECILFKKEVLGENNHIKILFEDIDGNEFYLSTSYIKSYIRVPIWCRKRHIPDYLKGHEYEY